MKLTIVVLLVAAVAVSASIFDEQEYETRFTQWVQQHNKRYDADEFFYRFNVFKANVDKIELHNQGNHRWTMAMNKFGDMTADEFIATHTGYNNIKRGVYKAANTKPYSKVKLPQAVDWRLQGAVTGVKDQGQCGSCWAFSATGSIEGAHFLKTKKLVSFSEQELVDCSAPEGNEGCEGGEMDAAFQYVIDNKGLATEKSYPYTGQDGDCESKGKTNGGTISSYTDCTPNDNDALRAMAATTPVSIAIEADQDGFQFYSGGVFDGDCGDSLDHGVLVVGYNQTSTPNYWIVKNSWSASWGDNGYIYLVDDPTLNGGSGQCGMLSDPSIPVI